MCVPMKDGTLLVGDLFLPDAPGRYPVILGCHPYNNELQSSPVRPVGHSNLRGFIEAGDPEFFVRRGYVHAIFSVRGTGKSQGRYVLMGPPEAEDVAELIAWLATQPWSTGRVGMFGVSYFSWLQQKVATLNPPALGAIFAPFGATDFYRDVFYRGGILGHAFLQHWIHHLDNLRPESWSLAHLGEEGFSAAIARAMQNEDVMAVPSLREALQRPREGRNPAVVDILLNDLDGPYYAERNIDAPRARVPAYLGACWGSYGMHLPGAFRSWSQWGGPKKLVVGPPFFLDRPLFQYQYESLRWFDHWLKGNDTGIMDEPAVRIFVPPTGDWRRAEDWPLPETCWTPFFLHERGLLSEHEFWPGEGADSFEDSTFLHEALTYWTPTLVENTEVIGPVAVEVYIAATDPDPYLFASLLLLDRDGHERELTRGWLRASQRGIREELRPGEVVLAHRSREPLEPGTITALRFPLVPTARLVLAGERIGLRLKAADDEEAADRPQAVARGALWRQTPVRITLHHDADHPSHVLLPIVRGNIVGTYLSGGVLWKSEPGTLPVGKIDRPKEVGDLRIAPEGGQKPPPPH